jgi:glycosyltransferase involved in cell wall biosynthesis
VSSPERSATHVIGFDGSRLTGRPRTGTESYAHELLLRLAPIAAPGELRVYLNASAPPDDLPGEIEIRTIPASRLWTHGRLSLEMRAHRPGVLFVPSHVVPVAHPRSVVTIHDLAYLVTPESFTRRERIELDLSTQWSVRSASRIIAVSQQTRTDLIERYKVDPQKVVVIHHGVGPRFLPVPPEEVQPLLQRFGLDRPYVLAVGTLHPRKNLAMLAAAWERAVDQGLEADLVLCGSRGPRSNDCLRRIAASRHAGQIRLLDYVSSAELPGLYTGAALFVLPSRYEGFGMTALEAMACGTPVLAASSGALPEVCGNGARFIDPLDEEAWTDEMMRFLAQPDLRARLALRGRARASHFTWERSAMQSMMVLRATRDGEPISQDALSWGAFAHRLSADRTRDEGLV